MSTDSEISTVPPAEPAQARPPQNINEVDQLLGNAALGRLAAMAQPEDWSSASAWHGGEYFVLRSYLSNVYQRCVEQNKVLVSADGSFAAFNTGLVTPAFGSLYCCIERSTAQGSKRPWMLVDFVDGARLELSDIGHRIVSELGLPERATFGYGKAYIYNDDGKEPQLKLKHLVDERIWRYPTSYLVQVTGGSREDVIAFQRTAEEAERKGEKKAWIFELPSYVEGVNAAKLRQRVRADLRDAVLRARQAVATSYAMAVPTWYVRWGAVNIMLPLAMGGDEVNLALVTNRTKDGKVFGNTVFDLDMARADARLVSIPQAAWARGGKAPVVAPDLDITPVADRTAWLMWSGNAVSLFDGATIGRASSNHQADIELSGAAYAYASRVHGRFGRSGDAWTFTSEGRNGSRVRRMGEWITLESGVPFELKDGDRIQMGEPAGWHDDDWRNLVLFSTVKPDLDVTPQAL